MDEPEVEPLVADAPESLARLDEPTVSLGEPAASVDAPPELDDPSDDPADEPSDDEPTPPFEPEPLEPPDAAARESVL